MKRRDDGSPQAPQAALMLVLLLASCAASLVARGIFLVFVLTSILSLGALILLLIQHSTDLSRRRLHADLIAPLLCIAGVNVLYWVGVRPTANPPYGVNPGSSIQTLSAVGMLLALVGALTAAVMPTKTRAVPADDTGAGPDIVNVPTIVMRFAYLCIPIAVVNFATGVIPLLSVSIADARYASAGQYGSLGRFWPFVYAGLQVAILALAVQVWLRRHLSAADAARILVFVIPLVLSGSRSFVITVIIALAFMLVSLGKLNLLRLAVGAAVVAAAAAWFGAARTNSDIDYAPITSYSVAQPDLTAWDALQLAVGTGPRVWQLAEVADSGNQSGYPHVLFDDLLNGIPHGGFATSDRWVTERIGRDPSSVGGSPPTLIGGFDLDFGPWGALVGSFVWGASLVLSVRGFVRRRSWGTLLWSGFWLATGLISVYSYLSIKPALVIVFTLCLTVWRVPLRRSGTAPGDAVEVSRANSARF